MVFLAPPWKLCFAFAVYLLITQTVVDEFSNFDKKKTSGRTGCVAIATNDWNDSREIFKEFVSLQDVV